jgi:AbrB family looped-hinge helix DNA binding protein
METVKTSSKGQIVIPKTIRERLNIREGTEMTAEVMPDQSVRLRVRDKGGRRERVAAIAGCLAAGVRAQPRLSAEDEEAAIGRLIKRDDARTRRDWQARKGRKS